MSWPPAAATMAERRLGLAAVVKPASLAGPLPPLSRVFGHCPCLLRWRPPLSYGASSR